MKNEKTCKDLLIVVVVIAVLVILSLLVLKSRLDKCYEEVFCEEGTYKVCITNGWMYTEYDNNNTSVVLYVTDEIDGICKKICSPDLEEEVIDLE